MPAAAAKFAAPSQDAAVPVRARPAASRSAEPRPGCTPALAPRGVEVNFVRASIFNWQARHPAYDLVRDSFGWLTEVDLRRMRQMPPDSDLIGESFLWAGLFRRSP